MPRSARARRPGQAWGRAQVPVIPTGINNTRFNDRHGRGGETQARRFRAVRDPSSERSRTGPGARGAGVVEGFEPERWRSGRGKSPRRAQSAAQRVQAPAGEEVRDLKGSKRSSAEQSREHGEHPIILSLGERMPCTRGR